jgi:hypothetical protein
MTPLQLDGAAREWLLDCEGSFADDPEDYRDMILLLDYAEVHAAVDRYYDGGWAAFEATV